MGWREDSLKKLEGSRGTLTFRTQSEINALNRTKLVDLDKRSRELEELDRKFKNIGGLG